MDSDLGNATNGLHSGPGPFSGNVTGLNPPISTGNKTPLNRLPPRPNLSAPRRTAAAKKKTVVENRIVPLAKEIIAFQDVIHFFSNVDPRSPLRQKLLYGSDGAPKFDEVHFEMLIKIRELITGHHRDNDFLSYPQEETFELKTSSQHLTLLMSGSPTPIAGKSYSYAEVNNLIQRTMRSTYYGTRQAEQQSLAAERQLQAMSNTATANILKPFNGQLVEDPLYPGQHFF